MDNQTKENLLKAKQLNQELDQIFQEYHDKIDALITPYVNQVANIIKSNPQLTKDDLNSLLSHLPPGFHRAELRALYNSLN